MASRHTVEGPIDTEEAFELALADLLRSATDSGVTVTGGWEPRKEGEGKWDVVVLDVE
ncbi:hypothetical protein [Natronorarus salvus]|uniref:hypothetical protein n=1 Tax=Natronorarus salvus TaxID=3117733 RepID=UPI002F264F74